MVKRIFDYSVIQLMVLILLSQYVSYLLSVVYGYGVQAGLASSSNPTEALSFGEVFRSNFINHLPYSLLVIILLARYFGKTSMVRLNRILLIIVSVLFIVSLSLSFTLSGVDGLFNFLGYRGRNLSLCLYGIVGLFLFYRFRFLDLPTILWIVVVGVLLVGELWELPLNFRYSKMHPFLFLLGYLRRYIPFGIWMFEFRKVYLSRANIKLMLAPIFSIILFNFMVLNTIYVIPSVYLSFLLRMSWAFLVIFIPFRSL